MEVGPTDVMDGRYTDFRRRSTEGAAGSVSTVEMLLVRAT
jgi:hypothetical protein